MPIDYHVPWLVLGVLLVSLHACYSQNELALRKVQMPYPQSIMLQNVSGSLMTNGLNPLVTGLKNFRTLELIEGRLFVGGRDELFSVDTANFTILNNVSIPTRPPAASCDGCYNFIRVIQLLSNETHQTLLECGTNNKKPYCQHRSLEDLTELQNISRIEFDSPFSVIPFTSSQNSTGWLTNGTDLYVGTNLELIAGSVARPAISKLTVPTPSQNMIGKQLVTTMDRSVLDIIADSKPDPQFVGDPISYNGRVYFFFREIAIEFFPLIIVHSRVAVVCQNDKGGKKDAELSEEDFVTFVKARLTCFINGDSIKLPYHYNEIQDVYQSTGDINVVFAIFATQAPVVASSAVCAYRLDEIEALFLSTDNEFLSQASSGQKWGRGPTDPVTPRLATCQHVGSDNLSDSQYTAILNEGQILSVSAENEDYYTTTGGANSNPLLVIDGERFSQIVVDENVFNITDVMFIGTENGAVLKAYLNADRSEAKVVEEINLDTDKSPVLTMLLSDSDQAVFVGTHIGVYKVPLQHCQDYNTRVKCLDIKDPYCRWNGTFCVTSNEGEQNLTSGAEQAANITVRQDPPSVQIRHLNITDQPITLYLLAEAPPGQNLSVNGSVSCDMCASLPYTEYQAVSLDREYLSLTINGSNSSENMNCSCSVELVIDGGDHKTVNFTLIVDDSAAVPATEMQIQELETFDTEIRKYKGELEMWKSAVGESCGLKDVKVCQP